MHSSNKDYYPPMHTAEHILNQTMVRMFNINRSVTNHIERKKSKCDYHFYSDISEKEIRDIENQVNEIINQDLNVTEEWWTYSEATDTFDLSNIPEEKDKKIRVVRVGNYDTCPCIGPHVEKTSQIGTFRITSYTYSNNVLRIRFKLP